MRETPLKEKAFGSFPLWLTRQMQCQEIKQPYCVRKKVMMAQEDYRYLALMAPLRALPVLDSLPLDFLICEKKSLYLLSTLFV